LRFYIVLIGKKEFQGFLYITVLSAQPSYWSKWINTKVGQTHSWMTTFYAPSKYKYVYIYINWSVYGVYSTTETGLPLFTNTDLEFVFNLNID